ncbi:hypothetical protein [Serratia sp. M24T3]|uniref:hypothetical protein n=1 Tax=Serratia sp. M24T3 TaxID=932213 RepID=UPI00025B9BD0|nr:hypothetical protein [Serratia sp. M24T3]EIC84268.1 hypothetical protein SPM24T3_12354 [Serratia sp. M24T3]
MFKPVKKISILAGNSRVSINDNNNIDIECQVAAFEAALKFAYKIREEQGYLPKISVAFDHIGIFRLQFLTEGLTNSQKRHPRINNLHPTIRKIYEPVSEKYQIPLDKIIAIHEDSARQHLMHIISTKDISQDIYQRLVTKVHVNEIIKDDSIVAQAQSLKLTCGAITKEYFDRAAGGKKDAHAFLDVFFEESPWSKSLIFARGIQLSHLLGLNTAIRLNLVSEAGEISRGEIIFPPKFISS